MYSVVEVKRSTPLSFASDAPKVDVVTWRVTLDDKPILMRMEDGSSGHLEFYDKDVAERLARALNQAGWQRDSELRIADAKAKKTAKKP